ncbi:MAG: SDR family NAD(P)-dependent oxidoreductase [Proteobacteria bacterium]|nr:SDR family NAD(P)-dependent oxidoreductase [Pseudomonadota bacterium]
MSASAPFPPRSPSGQVAVVTGAASGLGLAIAERLTEEGVRAAWAETKQALGTPAK